jgi:hypothetical protein
MRELAKHVKTEADTDEISAAAVQSSIAAAQRAHFDEHSGTQDVTHADVQARRGRPGTEPLDTGGGGAGTPELETAGTGRLLFKPEGGGPQQVFPLGAVTTIGRGADTDIPLAEQGISRRHCRIVREGGAYQIEDTGSRNGVRVNGRKVDRARLVKGDKLLVGKAVLFFLE